MRDWSSAGRSPDLGRRHAHRPSAATTAGRCWNSPPRSAVDARPMHAGRRCCAAPTASARRCSGPAAPASSVRVLWLRPAGQPGMATTGPTLCRYSDA
ncbi:hypothetical protein G6F62_015290 [Rhizopus arrhizus]|nr:hypothetical protein G6F62_015290 [Rhizopus arrhizus]